MSDDGGERNEWEDDEEEFDFDERSEEDSDVDDEEEDSDDEDEDDEDFDIEKSERKLKKKKITNKVLEDFEYAEIIKKRVKQIEEGANVNEKVVEYMKSLNNDKSIDMAMEEFRRDLIDFQVTRTLKNGNIEIWKRNDFKYLPKF